MRTIAIADSDDPAEAIRRLGLSTRPVLVVVGGAAGVDEAALTALEPCAEALVRAADGVGAAIVDGGTDAGVMRLVGVAHAAARSHAPLVGVAVEALAADELEPNHTHLVLVPGSEWGDEVPWLTGVAAALAGGHPSVTVLVNGGEIALLDVAESVAAGRRVLVVSGTGRAADALAGALAGNDADPRAGELVRSGLVEAVSLREDTPPPLETRVRAILGGRMDVL
jgi:SLOG in TRPM, prokaryote